MTHMDTSFSKIRDRDASALKSKPIEYFSVQLLTCNVAALLKHTGQDSLRLANYRAYRLVNVSVSKSVSNSTRRILSKFIRQGDSSSFQMLLLETSFPFS